MSSLTSFAIMIRQDVRVRLAYAWQCEFSTLKKCKNLWMVWEEVFWLRSPFWLAQVSSIALDGIFIAIPVIIMLKLFIRLANPI